MHNQYALTLKHPAPGHMFDVKNSKEFHNCFYFDLAVPDAFNLNNPVPIGGPAGIIVSKKDMHVLTISFGNLSVLKKKEADLEILYNLFTGNNSITDQLDVLKKKFKIKSGRFLHLQREILGKDRKLVLDIIQDLPDLQKNNLPVDFPGDPF